MVEHAAKSEELRERKLDCNHVARVVFIWDNPLGCIARVIHAEKSLMRFHNLIIDPNWFYALRLNEQFGGNRTRFGDGASGKYDLSPLEEIKAMPFPDIMADDCMVHMWTTGPHDHEVKEVFDAFGLKSVTMEFIWIKIAKSFLEDMAQKPLLMAEMLMEHNIYEVLTNGTRRLPGHYTASNGEFVHLGIQGEPEIAIPEGAWPDVDFVEFVRLGKKGKPPMPQLKMYPQVIFSPLFFGEHSRKPDDVHEFIEKAYPGQRYFEGYARRLRPGWCTLGNECPGQEGMDMRDIIPRLAALPGGADWREAIPRKVPPSKEHGKD